MLEVPLEERFRLPGCGEPVGEVKPRPLIFLPFVDVGEPTGVLSLLLLRLRGLPLGLRPPLRGLPLRLGEPEGLFDFLLFLDWDGLPVGVPEVETIPSVLVFSFNE